MVKNMFVNNSEIFLTCTFPSFKTNCNDSKEGTSPVLEFLPITALFKSRPGSFLTCTFSFLTCTFSFLTCTFLPLATGHKPGHRAALEVLGFELITSLYNSMYNIHTVIHKLQTLGGREAFGLEATASTATWVKNQNRLPAGKEQ